MDRKFNALLLVFHPQIHLSLPFLFLLLFGTTLVPLLAPPPTSFLLLLFRLFLRFHFSSFTVSRQLSLQRFSFSLSCDCVPCLVHFTINFSSSILKAPVDSSRRKICPYCFFSQRCLGPFLAVYLKGALLSMAACICFWDLAKVQHLPFAILDAPTEILSLLFNCLRSLLTAWLWIPPSTWRVEFTSVAFTCT